MTDLPAAGLFTDAATTNGGAKQAQDDIRNKIGELPGGVAESELTISAGTVAPLAGVSGAHSIDTEADASTDDLTHIAVTNLGDGAILILRNNTNGRDVVVKHGSGGSGEIILSDSVDLTLDDTRKFLKVQLRSTTWYEVGRFLGTGSFARKQATVVALTATTTLTADDDGKTFDCDASGGDFTVDLTAVASLPNGCEYVIRSTGTSGAVTIDPAGAETIDAATTLLLRNQYQTVRIRSDGTDWHAIGGSPALRDLHPEQATTSGTNKDFTGIPPWAKRITLMWGAGSTGGTSHPTVRLGDSGGFETTGYVGTITQMAGSNTSNALSSGFRINGGTTWAATIVVEVVIVLTLQDASDNTWMASISTARTDSASNSIGTGRKALSGTLTQIQLTTENGTDAFDAGAVSILVE